MTKGSGKKKLSAHSQGGSILSFFQKTPDRRKSGASVSDAPAAEVEHDTSLVDRKGKAKAVWGSELDPVVISDDEEPGFLSGFAEDDNRIRTSPPLLAQRSTSEMAEPGPLRSPHRSCSPPSAPPVDPPPSHASPAIAAYPEWIPPTTWPDIINTAHQDEDEDSAVGRDAIPDDASRDPGDDCDIIDEDDSGIDIIEEEADIMKVDSPMNFPRRRDMEVDNESLSVDGLGNMMLEMEWDEGDDEGMGMEEEGDELPEPKLRPGSKRERNGEKVTECPVCGTSLKVKPNTVSILNKLSELND
jgi:DNA cross-link repair 1A protein